MYCETCILYGNGDIQTTVQVHEVGTFYTPHLWQSLVILKLKRQQKNCTSAHSTWLTKTMLHMTSAQVNKLYFLSNHLHTPNQIVSVHTLIPDVMISSKSFRKDILNATSQLIIQFICRLLIVYTNQDNSCSKTFWINNCTSEINPNLHLAWETYVLLIEGKSEYYWEHQQHYHFHKLCSIL